MLILILMPIVVALPTEQIFPVFISGAILPGLVLHSLSVYRTGTCASVREYSGWQTKLQQN